MRSNLHPDEAAAPNAAAAPTPSPVAAAVPQALEDAADKGKQLLENINSDQLVSKLPQSVRDLGTQVADRVRGFTPTQQILGAAALAFGIGLLAVRSNHNKRTADAKAGRKYRAKFDGKPFKGRSKSKYSAS